MLFYFMSTHTSAIRLTIIKQAFATLITQLQLSISCIPYSTNLELIFLKFPFTCPLGLAAAKIIILTWHVSLYRPNSLVSILLYSGFAFVPSKQRLCSNIPDFYLLDGIILFKTETYFIFLN